MPRAKIQQRRNGLLRSQVLVVRGGALVHDWAFCFDGCYTDRWCVLSSRGALLLIRKLSSELHYLSFHLSILATLSYPFEVGLDLAFQAEAPASRTNCERFLDNITS